MSDELYNLEKIAVTVRRSTHALFIKIPHSTHVPPFSKRLGNFVIFIITFFGLKTSIQKLLQIKMFPCTILI